MTERNILWKYENGIICFVKWHPSRSKVYCAQGGNCMDIKAQLSAREGKEARRKISVFRE
jgi:hypothetical protein